MRRDALPDAVFAGPVAGAAGGRAGTALAPARPGDGDGDDGGPAGGERLRVRTVWISDLHLGTPGCQAVALLDFLRRVECETLFLVGDIIDGWQLKRSWYWPQAHNDVVQKLLRKARKGTKVIFVPGNHDEFARRYLGHNFGGVDVVEEHVHLTADGRRLWVTHGDHFDGVIQCAKWLAHVGDWAYELTLRVNRHFNSVRARLGLPYWSLSRYLKLKVKRAVSYVGDFEAAVAREARARGLQGVVCGHIHHAEMRMVDGILYCNDGDWVESLTALVEHGDGRLEIIDWSAAEHAEGTLQAQAQAQAQTQAQTQAQAQAQAQAAQTAQTAQMAKTAQTAQTASQAAAPASTPTTASTPEHAHADAHADGSVTEDSHALRAPVICAADHSAHEHILLATRPARVPRHSPGHAAG